MSALEIIRLIVRYFHYIAGSAICLTLLVIFSTQDDKRVFETHTLLNTGLISGYSIESSGAGRIDYAKTNNELENLINLATSFETNKELSARLLAKFLILDHQQKLPLLKQNYSDFIEVVKSLPIEVKERDTELSILYDIISKRDADRANPFYQLANSDNPFFGNKQLETILVAREGKSDMIRVEYKSIDPYLSQVTLELLTDIFIAEQKSNKEGQTDSVIGFFKSAVDQSDAKLKGAEDELLSFRVSNRIINYY
jgi:succinoglycan biosynthesis transport protein ExoP